MRKLAEELARNDNQTTRADASLPPLDLASPTTVIRVSSSKGVSLTILPLVLPALHKLSTDVLDNVRLIDCTVNGMLINIVQATNPRNSF